MGKVVVAKRGAERIRRGEVWVFLSDLAGEPDATPGDIVEVCDQQTNTLAYAFYGPSQLSLRILTRETRLPDRDFFYARLAQAVARRKKLFPERDAVRLVHGEADLLPGLLVDKFGDGIVVQSLSLAVDHREQMFVDMLVELVGPRVVVARDDGMTREYENLEDRKGILYGAGSQVTYREGGLTFGTDLLGDQKTGAFLDQYENHLMARDYACGEALDLFSYHGGFGLQLAGRARAVTCVDQSEVACRRIAENANRNGIENTSVVCANAFDYVRELEREGRRFDVVVVDPPAFAKRKSALDAALRGYKDLNLRALRLLSPGGILISCSCSAKVTRDLFEDMLIDAARDAKKKVAVLERRGAGRDHPGLLGIPETEYLKCFVLEVRPA